MFSRASFALPAAHRVDGRSRALLAASFRRLRDGEPGWITMQEAGKLFSSVEESNALDENDKIGNANLAAFTSALEAQIEFAPSAGRLYLTRRAASGMERRGCRVSANCRDQHGRDPPRRSPGKGAPGVYVTPPNEGIWHGAELSDRTRSATGGLIAGGDGMLQRRRSL
jgi:hypothetical protein